MAIADLLFKKIRGQIDDIELDVTISESHVYPTTITKYPVESGSVKSDHIINEPVVLTMEGLITNTPIKIFGGRVGQLIRKEPFDRRKTNYEALIDLRKSKTPFTVVTGLTTYKDMFFTSLTIPRDATTGDALRFSAITTPIVTVNSKTVKLKDIAPEYSDTAQSKINKGAQNKTPIAAGTKLESTAIKLGRFFKGLFR